jgi:hypothetical protein
MHCKAVSNILVFAATIYAWLGRQLAPKFAIPCLPEIRHFLTEEMIVHGIIMSALKVNNSLFYCKFIAEISASFNLKDYTIFRAASILPKPVPKN